MKSLAENIAVAMAYLATAKLGFLLALEQTNATAVWPPTGIALAACLAIGFRIWPGIFLGAFLANIIVLAVPFFIAAGSVCCHSGTASGNTRKLGRCLSLSAVSSPATSPFLWHL